MVALLTCQQLYSLYIVCFLHHTYSVDTIVLFALYVMPYIRWCHRDPNGCLRLAHSSSVSSSASMPYIRWCHRDPNGCSRWCHDRKPLQSAKGLLTLICEVIRFHWSRLDKIVDAFQVGEIRNGHSVSLFLFILYPSFFTSQPKPIVHAWQWQAQNISFPLSKSQPVGFGQIRIALSRQVLITQEMMSRLSYRRKTQPNMLAVLPVHMASFALDKFYVNVVDNAVLELLESTTQGSDEKTENLVKSQRWVSSLLVLLVLLLLLMMMMMLFYYYWLVLLLLLLLMLLMLLILKLFVKKKILFDSLWWLE